MPAFCLAVALAVGPASPAAAKVFHSQSEALALVFPDADRIVPRTFVIGGAQARQIEQRARARLETRIVKFHAGHRGDELLGHAIIDVHTVRTLPEAFLVVIDPQGEVASLRVLAFHEPLDYLPTDRWFQQFAGRGLGDELRLGGDIHGIMGATLSARAVTSAVRRALALWEILVEPSLPSAPSSAGSSGLGAADASADTGE